MRPLARVIVRVEATAPEGTLEIKVTVMLPVGPGITVVFPAGNGGKVAVGVSSGSEEKNTVPEPVGPVIAVSLPAGKGGNVDDGIPVMVPGGVPWVKVEITVKPVPESVMTLALPVLTGRVVEFMDGKGGAGLELERLVGTPVSVEMMITPVPEMVVTVAFAVVTGEVELAVGNGA